MGNFAEEVEPVISEEIGIGEKDALEQFLSSDRSRGFNLREAPLWRVTLLQGSSWPSRIIWTFHHLLLDGRSHWNVFREVLVLLGFLANQTPPDLKRIPTFRSFLEVRRDRTKNGEAELWRTVLGGVSFTPSSKGASAPSGPVRRGRAEFELSIESTLGLRELSTRVDVSVHNIVQAAWTLTLHELEPADIVVFGSTRACRHWGGNQQPHAVGMFINTVPFPVRMNPAAPLGDWLRSIRDLQRRLRRGELAAPAEIREWIGLDAATELFASILVYEDTDTAASFPPNVGVVKLVEKCDLLTVGVVLGTKLKVVVEGQETDLNGQSVKELAASFSRNLSNLGQAAPASPTTGLFKQTSQIQAIPSSSFGPILDFDRNKTVVDLILEFAKSHADSPAIEQGELCLSYSELVEASANLGAVLREAGLRDEEPVILCFSRTADFVVAALGVMMAGGAYVPVDPSGLPAQAAIRARDCAARFAVTEESHASILGTSECRLFSVENLPPSNPGERVSRARPSGRSYIIYTSGSTGRPKGVEVEHRSLSCLVAHYGTALSLGRSDRMTFLAATTFDFSIGDIWPCMAHGACLIIPADPEVFGSPRGIIEWLASSKATIAGVGTALVEVMFSLRWPSAMPLRVLLTGGDALHCHPPAGSPFRFINCYGPTENTVDATWATILPGPGQAPPDIGYPISNVSAHVLDSHMRQVGIGIEGELYVGGEQVARGYLNLPEKTNQVFLADPFSDRPGARLYKTGDMVRRRENGSLEYLGRRDNQIQIRGRRVELAEVEAAMLRAPDVVQVCCRPIYDGRSVSGITGHAVLAESAPEDWETRLRDHLNATLDPALIPSRFVRHGAFPVTKHGKFDREVLDRLAMPTDQPIEDLPDEPVARAVTNTWIKHLGPHFKTGDSFQMLGGDSLLAVKLVLSLEESLGIRISTSEFRLTATLDEIIALVRGKERQVGQPILIFRPEGDRIPIFAMYGVDGEVAWFHNLATHLPLGRKLYGFRSPATDDIGACQPTLKKAAADVAQAILKQSGTQPVALVGYSWGGVLATEVASQLREAGGECAKIFLIDSQPPPRPLGIPARALHFARWMPSLLLEIAKGRGLRARFREFKEEHQLAEQLVRGTAAPPSYLNWSKEIEFAHHWLAARHSFSIPTDLSLTLFRSENDTVARAHPMNPYLGQFRPCWGWSHWVDRGPTIHQLSSAHVDLIKSPCSKVIAHLIEAELTEAEDSVRPSPKRTIS